MINYSVYGPEYKWEEHYINCLCRYCKATVKKRSLFTLDITSNHPNWYGEVLRKNIIVQNEQTGQFFAINHADQPSDIPKGLPEHSLCIGVLKCQYRAGEYGEHEPKISPFTYGVKEPENYFAFRERFKPQRESSTLYFKGNETGRRNILQRLAAMSIINPDFGIRDAHGSRSQKVSQQEYLDRMAKSKLILSLPGIGAHCHRELEAFGLGVPVLMPPLMNQYYNDLIPDFHYIAIKSPSSAIKKFTKEEEKAFCEAVKTRYHEVINDDHYLQWISDNASDWFEQNIVYPNNMRLLERILLEKFKYQM